MQQQQRRRRQHQKGITVAASYGVKSRNGYCAWQEQLPWKTEEDEAEAEEQER